MNYKKILVVGAGAAGQEILEDIKKNPDLKMKVVGFVDDNPEKLNTYINGIKIVGSRDGIPLLCKKNKIDEVIIAMPSAEGENISEIVKICVNARVRFKIVPRVKEVIEGRANIYTIRKVQVEDLLGRPVVKADVPETKKFFKGKVALVTGAAGSIGSELSRQIAVYRPKKLILVDWWENGMFDLHQELIRDIPQVRVYYIIANIQDEEKMKKLFRKYKPDYVFHAAAYKHVPLMEDHPDEAVKNNIFGTMSVANAAIYARVKKFVLVSTDKAAKPINIMGATKYIAEGIIKSLNSKKIAKFMIVRFGNVLESNGSVIPLFRKQIEYGGPVTITDRRMTRYFMTIPEAAQLIIKAASLGNGGELFVLDMGEPVKILDLAENLIRLSGYIPGKDIKIIFTGKRKGEKLNEVLFNDKEEMIATKDGKIFRTQSNGIDTKKLPLLLKKLQKNVITGNINMISKVLFPKS